MVCILSCRQLPMKDYFTGGIIFFIIFFFCLGPPLSTKVVLRSGFLYPWGSWCFRTAWGVSRTAVCSLQAVVPWGLLLFLRDKWKVSQNRKVSTLKAIFRESAALLENCRDPEVITPEIIMEIKHGLNFCTEACTCEPCGSSKSHVWTRASHSFPPQACAQSSIK